MAPEAPDSVGRFQIKRALGRGAMGVVYLGEDPVLGREVAIKVIQVHPGLSEDQVAELRQRFENEARSAAKLSHPGLVTVFDAGLDDDSLFIAMEYVRGETLGAVMESERVLNYKEVADLALQIAGALDMAHSKGVVHRDIKPGNVLINRRGQPKITDFGVARQATSTLTATGTIIGTPAYMSPEQVTGHEVTGAADQFSFGVVLYEMLTGEKPFAGEGATTILYKIVHEQPPTPVEVQAGLPATVDDVIMRALAKDPAERYPDCVTLAEALRDALGAAPADGATLLTSTGAHPGTAAAASGPEATDPNAATQVRRATPSAEATDPDAATSVSAPPEPAAAAARAAATNVAEAAGPDRRVIAIAAAGILVALVGAIAWWASSGPDPAPTDPVAAGESVSGAGGPEAADLAGTSAGTGAEQEAGAAVVAPETPVPAPAEPEAIETFRIESRPPGAAILLNGDRLRVSTPADVMLRPGERHSIRLDLADYQPVSWAFQLDDLSEEQRRSQRLFFPMQPLRAEPPPGGGRPGGGQGRPPGRPPGGPGAAAGRPAGVPEPELRPVRVRGSMEAPAPLERFEPEYPDWAAEQGLARFVVLELVIDREGFVRRARPLRAVHPQLEQLAIDAAYRWRFSPATRDGRPVDAFHNVSITFRQDGPARPSE